MRGRNTTEDQISIYLSAIEQEPLLREVFIGNKKLVYDVDKLNEIWDVLREALNNCENAPKCTINEWKQRFSSWKYKLLAKATNFGISTSDLKKSEKRALIILQPPNRTFSKSAPYSSSPLSEVVKPDAYNKQHNENEWDGELEKTVESPTNFVANPAAIKQRRSSRLEQKRGIGSLKRIVTPNGDTEEEITKKKIKNNNYLNAYLTLKHYQADLMMRTLRLEEKKFKLDMAKFKFENPSFDFSSEDDLV